MLSLLGSFLIRAGEVTARVNSGVEDVGARRGLQAESFAVPGGLFVRVDGAAPGAAVDFAKANLAPLRLDQVNALYELLKRLRTTEVPLAEVTSALHRIDSMPHRFSPVTVITGHMLMTVGFGLLLHHATWAAVAAFAVLGIAVGIPLAAARTTLISNILRVGAAIGVSAAAVRWAGPLTGESPAHMLIAPLVALLPGPALTTGTIDLATGAPVAGVARLAGAIYDLLLLALGILAGIHLASPAASVDPQVTLPSAWVAWLGVLALGCGYVLYRSAPAGLLPWLLAALCVERLAQLAGTWVTGPVLGSFTAGLVLPLAAAAVERSSDIPSKVIFLPAFWMLVPGAIGLTAVSRLFLTKSGGNLSDLITAAVTLLAVVLGIVISSRVTTRHPVVVRGQVPE
jgi:uncharacterized membrane protein YjjP (DUF1212 family)/uncharacterized membrane protein YjjB (DUF3815 family)